MRNKIHLYTLLALAGCLVTLFGSGCSSGNQTIQPASTSKAGRGAVQIMIHWPSVPQSRLIPLASQMIQITLTDSDGTVWGTGSSQRPTSGNTSTITIADVFNGSYTETASAYPASDTTGVPQATGQQSIVVVAGQVNKTADLEMSSTITSLLVTPANPTATVGGTPLTLNASAQDANHNVVMTAPANIVWTLAPTTTATLTKNANGSASVKGLAKGTANVTVKETESGVSSVNVAIAVGGGTTTPPPTGPNIVIADTGNNRIVGLDAIPPTTTVTYNDSGSGTAFGGVIGVAHDSSGRIYVADYYAKLVRIDDFTGKNRVAYAPSGISLNFIYVDRAGKIYWLDNNGAVNRIDDMTGANHLIFGANVLGGSPTSIAVDSSNRIYVWDGSNQVIRFDDMIGKNIIYYGAQGSGVGHFNTLSSGSVSIDSADRIYIADQSNKRIVRIDDMTGKNWTEFDIPADSGAAVNPDKVSVDSSTSPSIYFMVQSTGTVFKCSDMTGKGLTKLGTLANGVTPLHYPSALYVK